MYWDIIDLVEVPHTEAILGVTYACPDDIDPAVKTLLRRLQRLQTVSGEEPPIPINLAAYRESWRIVKENTSSQGPHIGM